MNDKNMFDDAPVIFSYTRAQAIDDGVLVDMTDWAKETGFRIPVACTAAVWHDHITPPDNTKALGQSERGRAHDVLWMLWVAIKAGKSGPRNLINYRVVFLKAPGNTEEVTLKAHCGPGDDGEPVLTIMLPHED